MLDLKTINDRGKFTKNFICFLMELELGGDEIGEISKGLWGIENLDSSISFISYVIHGG